MYALAERNQVIELVQTLPDEQVHYVLNIIQSLPQESVLPRCTLRGRFAKYANPSLRAKEKDAWAIAADEKHSIISLFATSSTMTKLWQQKQKKQ